MEIGSLCKRDVVAIHAAATPRDAAVLMCEQHVGALVVTEHQDRPEVIGIVTDRDLVLEVLGRAEPASPLRMRDLAKPATATIHRDADLHDALAQMESAGVRRLLVLDDDGGIMGLVSSDDMLGAIADELESLASAMRRGIARESSERKVAAGPARPRLVYPAFGTLAEQ